MGLGWSLRDNDWNKLRQILQQIASLRFGPDATPTFEGIDLTGGLSIVGSISAGSATIGSLTPAGFVTNTVGGLLGTQADIVLTTDVSGILPVPNGGTGLATLTAGYIPYGAGTSALSSSANLTFGAVGLTANPAITFTNTTYSAKFGFVYNLPSLNPAAGTSGGWLLNVPSIDTLNATTVRLVNKSNILSAPTILENLVFDYASSRWNIRTELFNISGGGAGTYVLRPLSLYTGTNTNQLYLATDGKVGIGTVPTIYGLQVTGSIYSGSFIHSDGTLFVSAGYASFNYEFGNAIINSSLITDSDLRVVCGAGKTLILNNSVYEDINIAGYLLARPASSAPGVNTFRSTGGTDTGIETLAFAIGEKVHGGFELKHGYKEGTDVVFHVHWQGIAAPAGGTDNVQWRLTYIVARDGVTLAAATTIDSPDVAITTQYRCYRSDFGAIVGTNFKIGDQFMFTLERVAAASDDYAGDCLIETAGIHIQCDTLGSRSVSAK